MNNRPYYKELERLKLHYDEAMKRNYLAEAGEKGKDDFPYSEKYPLYLKRHLLDYYVSLMNVDTYNAYRYGEGKELEEGVRGRPPKFLSVASSSRFCFTSLDIRKDTKAGEGADFFALKGERIHAVYFEKPLPILGDLAKGHPSMDAYAVSEDTEYFFECKCQEMFGPHQITLSPSYFRSGEDLIVSHVPEEYLSRPGRDYEISPRAFGLEALYFDAKQFLTHLMGIKRNAKAKRKEFIYYYFLPCDIYLTDPKAKEVVEQTLLDAMKVFSCSWVQEYCQKENIHLTLAVKRGDFFHPSSKDNTEILFSTRP